MAKWSLRPKKIACINPLNNLHNFILDLILINFK